VTKEEGNLIDRLADEYKLLQNKIDKIGGFRFTIKGWSITVIIGALFAKSATDSIPLLAWVVPLLIFLFLFFWFEKEQTDLRHRFGQRALDIELCISRILRRSLRASRNNDFALLQYVPGIAHFSPRHETRSGKRPWWRSWWDADAYFYLIQAAVVITIISLHTSLPPHVDHAETAGQAAAAHIDDQAHSGSGTGSKREHGITAGDATDATVGTSADAGSNGSEPGKHEKEKRHN
jgi:hypothetical protein